LIFSSIFDLFSIFRVLVGSDKKGGQNGPNYFWGSEKPKKEAGEFAAFLYFRRF